jgi:metal-sulfur cluster biosynthetic enzyme
MLEDVEDRIRQISEVRNVSIDLTFDPPWTPELIDADVRAALNFK